jgi:hypothetical protein
MKSLRAVLMVVLAGCFAAAGALTEDEIEDLKRKIKIGSIHDYTVEDSDDTKYELLKFYTYQDEDSVDEYTFYMRVTVELTEKESQVRYFAQFARTLGEVDSEYTGEDNWLFVVAHGDLIKPKLSAFVIQYGVLVEKEGDKMDFIILAEKMDDVRSLRELMSRSPNRAAKKPRILHQYSYRDEVGGVEDGESGGGSGSVDDGILQSSWN